MKTNTKINIIIIIMIVVVQHHGKKLCTRQQSVEAIKLAEVHQRSVRALAAAHSSSEVMLLIQLQVIIVQHRRFATHAGTSHAVN